MKSAVTAGYSGTPLARKLGIAAGIKLYCRDAPNDYQDLLAPLPADVTFLKRPSAATDMVHLFMTDRVELQKQLTSLRRLLNPEAAVWVSWPKKASKVPTSITEEEIRRIALPLGFVDIKVCAVDQIWSGLKLVVRKELR